MVVTSLVSGAALGVPSPGANLGTHCQRDGSRAHDPECRRSSKMSRDESWILSLGYVTYNLETTLICPWLVPRGMYPAD